MGSRRRGDIISWAGDIVLIFSIHGLGRRDNAMNSKQTDFRLHPLVLVWLCWIPALLAGCDEQART
jgi:hypothetical protein